MDIIDLETVNVVEGGKQANPVVRETDSSQKGRHTEHLRMENRDTDSEYTFDLLACATCHEDM